MSLSSSNLEVLCKKTVQNIFAKLNSKKLPWSSSSRNLESKGTQTYSKRTAGQVFLTWNLRCFRTSPQHLRTAAFCNLAMANEILREQNHCIMFTFVWMTANLKLRYLKKRKIDLYKNQFFISYDTIGATLLFIVIQILTSLFSFEEKKIK